MMGKSVLWVSLAIGIADKKQKTYTRDPWASKQAVWEVLRGEHNLNSSQQV